MKLPTLLLAATFALIVPVGVFAYHPPDNAPRAAILSASEGAASDGLLRIRLAHEGAAREAEVVVTAADGGTVHAYSLTLADGEHAEVVALPAAEYEVALRMEAGGLFGFTLAGSAAADLLACAESAAEVLFHTLDAGPGNVGIRVPGAVCMTRGGEPEVERHVDVARTGVEVGAPYPTCPTSCTMAYSVLGDGGLEFVLTRPATVAVHGTWDTRSSLVARYAVWLFEPGDCEGCWMGIEGRSGTGSVGFEVGPLPPGTYRASARYDGTPHASSGEHVWLDVAATPS